jgi:hypothetical protein
MIFSMRLCALAVCLVAFAASGCGFGDGVGTLAGALYVRGCSQSNDYGSPNAFAGYSMNPQFFEGQPVDSPPYERRFHPVNHLGIRMQNRALRQELADVLYVNIADVAMVAQVVNMPLTLGPATNVRATLKLNETCRYAEADAELDGTITFTSFGAAGTAPLPDNFQIGFGDRVAATLQVTVVDRRALTLGGVGPVPTAPAIGGQLSGSFDFIVEPGRPQPGF